jgi:hypothetical protein
MIDNCRCSVESQGSKNNQVLTSSVTDVQIHGHDEYLPTNVSTCRVKVEKTRKTRYVTKRTGIIPFAHDCYDAINQSIIRVRVPSYIHVKNEPKVASTQNSASPKPLYKSGRILPSYFFSFHHYYTTLYPPRISYLD